MPSGHALCYESHKNNTARNVCPGFYSGSRHYTGFITETKSFQHRPTVLLFTGDDWLLTINRMVGYYDIISHTSDKFKHGYRAFDVQVSDQILWGIKSGRQDSAQYRAHRQRWHGCRCVESGELLFPSKAQGCCVARFHTSILKKHLPRF